MQEKNLIHIWKEALSSRPASRETFKGMHLAVLHQAMHQKLEGHLFRIQFEIHDFVLCEIKGRPKEMTGFELPEKEEETLWLCMQFHGALSFPTGTVSQPDTIFSFISHSNHNLLTIPAEKQWVLFLGITGASRQQLLSELPLLRKQYGEHEKSITTAVPVSYVERQVLEAFSRTTFGPFSTMHHIGLLLSGLYGAYVQQIDKQGMQQGKDEGLITLYHQAIKYITEHYMDPDLNRITVSEALNCSTRSLSRAFEGRSATLNSSIMMIRLHRGRELLRKDPDLSIDDISGMLHFSDAKKFANYYKRCFHRTPREDRKVMLRSK